MNKRAELLQAIAKAGSGAKQASAVAALDAFDTAARTAAARERELDLGAGIAVNRMTPVAVHEHHTAATDWLADADTDSGDFRTAMIAEASAFVRGLPADVRADAEELAEQAHGRARTLASAYGSNRRAAEREFISFAAYLLQTEGASGLPQIDQTVDPNNAPAPTPYPTEVFDNFAPPQNDYNGGVEGEGHDSSISSEQAPGIQTIRSQDGGGSGYGSGPERPDQHSTQMDTSNSYAEVPLGPPGQIPTAPGGQPPATSTPNPIAGSDQVADDNGLQDEMGKRQGSYTSPDASGFRWVARAAEVMQPFHTACSTNHWPDEGCGHDAHTASLAISHAMDLEQAHRIYRCELIGAEEGQKAVQRASTLRGLANRHNAVTAAWADSERTAEDAAVLHGFMAVVRPVLATGEKQAAGELGSRLDFSYAPGRHAREAASTLTQIQQITDADNHETPGDDDLPEGTMFPLNEAFTQQWESGPGGAQPKSGQQKTAGPGKGMSGRMTRQWGSMDAAEGKRAQHQNDFYWSDKAHGQYVRGWNDTAGFRHGMSGRSPMTASDYETMTGRRDLHSHYMAAYQNGAAYAGRGDGSSAAGGAPANDYTVLSSRKTADFMTKPHQTTDDQAPPFNSQATTPDPFSSNAEPQDADFQAGVRDGKADLAAGQRPTFADNSSHASPYVQGYSSAFGGGAPGGQQDVPHSMGGDSGQAMNAGEAGTAFQVAKASLQAEGRDFSQAERDEDARHGDALPGGKLPIEDAEDLKNAERLKGKVKGVPKAEVNRYMERKEHEFGKKSLRASAAFVPDRAIAKPDFVKGYGYASRWAPGDRLVSTGSAAFEAGLYAGITDNPEHQAAFVAAHRKLAGKLAFLAARLRAHRSFTTKYAARLDDAVVRGLYVQAGTTVDLVTDGPGTSPDPMGSTPINGPGTPPPMGGLGDPAQPGGASPYQGAPPLPGGPVVPDDVMGKSQQEATPDGAPAMGFSGPGKEYQNTNLAPRGPNAANQVGYSNPGAYQGDPSGGDRVAVFRRTVQGNLQRMREQAS
jgi:hypothetical protein